jgi:hypothetical protein
LEARLTLWVIKMGPQEITLMARMENKMMEVKEERKSLEKMKKFFSMPRPYSSTI